MTDQRTNNRASTDDQYKDPVVRPQRSFMTAFSMPDPKELQDTQMLQPEPVGVQPQPAYPELAAGIPEFPQTPPSYDIRQQQHQVEAKLKEQPSIPMVDLHL